MAIVGPGNPLLRRICNALGIPKARSLTINMQLNDVVTVDAWFMPDESQLESVAAELEHKRYELHESAEDNG